MITLHYTANGTPLSDFDIESALDDIIVTASGGADATLEFSTSAIFHHVRAAIADGRIDHRNIAFVYDGQIVTVNEYGAIVNWPRTFLHDDSGIAEHILRHAMARRRAERGAQ